jgi:hypothetical protein
MTKPVQARVFRIVSTGVLVVFGAMMSGASAHCEIVDGAKKVPFAGKSLDGLAVEKRSLVRLNKAFPHLNVVERTYKGEVQTCSNCDGRYVICPH